MNTALQVYTVVAGCAFVGYWIKAFDMSDSPLQHAASVVFATLGGILWPITLTLRVLGE